MDRRHRVLARVDDGSVAGPGAGPANRSVFEAGRGRDGPARRDAAAGGILCLRHSKITAGSYRVEGDSGDKVRMAVTLNEGCRILNVSDGRRIETTPTVGAVSILPPGTRYAQTITGVASALLFEFSWPQIAGWIARETSIDPARVQLRTRICVEDDALARCLFGLATGAPDRWQEDLHGALDRLVAGHSNRAGRAANGRASGGLAPVQLKRVTELIEARPGHGPSLDDMAGEAGLSKFHFLRAFKATVGTTPHRHLLNRRLAWALEALLDRRLEIDEVAAGIGFSHASHLSRLLQRRFGLTPTDFRRSVFPQTTCGVPLAP